tara:strand:+ start:7861 stop:8793 length:933 start_codon:yes stop_codon:yes gene_type:complete
MKKILFATTALVATAGVAAADISISGRAAFGIYSQTGIDAFLQSDVDLSFTGTTETDGGVQLSATVDMDDFGNGGVGFGGANIAGRYNKQANVLSTTFTDTVVSATSGALAFSYGDTDGALDARNTEVHRILGIDAELWTNLVDNDDDGAIARLDYKMGAVAMSLSYAGQDDTWGIGASYSGDMGSAQYYVGAGYEDGPVGDLWAVSAGATFGSFSVRTAYWDGTRDNGAATGVTPRVGTVVEQWDVSAQYSANGLTVGANYLMDQTAADDDNWTVFGTYDLGGGAQLFAQHGEFLGTQERSSLGVTFAF